jgi:hypothetical protein
VADECSLIHPEVSKFNTFINQKKSPSLIAKLKIEVEYRLKKLLGMLGGKKQKEKWANAYTVLCSKQHDLEIF